jgi:cytochrome c oxidase assembly factor CtaG
VHILADWNWEPSIWIGVALLIGAYLCAIGPLRSRFGASEPVSRAGVAWFLLGAGVILFALVSPLDDLGDEYLFSAHMAQHLLLTLVAPPLLLMGTPGWTLRPILRYRIVTKVARVLTTPLVSFIVFNAVFLTWHLPALYEATLQNESVHILEHLLFMATGVLNWWPILSPLPELPRLSPPGQILYLFLEAVPATVLSALIVFAPTVLYPTYAAAPRVLGLDALADQQIAGLVMWTPGGLIYLGALTAVFFAWFGREERTEQDEPDQLTGKQIVKQLP